MTRRLEMSASGSGSAVAALLSVLPVLVLMWPLTADARALDLTWARPPHWDGTCREEEPSWRYLAGEGVTWEGAARVDAAGWKDAVHAGLELSAGIRVTEEPLRGHSMSVGRYLGRGFRRLLTGSIHGVDLRVRSIAVWTPGRVRPGVAVGISPAAFLADDRVRIRSLAGVFYSELALVFVGGAPVAFEVRLIEGSIALHLWRNGGLEVRFNLRARVPFRPLAGEPTFTPLAGISFGRVVRPRAPEPPCDTV